MSNIAENKGMENQQDAWYREVPPLIVLLILAAAMLMAALVAGGVTIGAAVVYGLDPSEAIQKLTDNPTPDVRSFFRWSQGASHFLLFVLASIGTMMSLMRAYRVRKPYFDSLANNWVSYFNLERTPKLSTTLLAVVMLICTLPLVQWSFAVNKALPLADWMRTLETDTADAIKGLLIMDNPWELIGNLLVIAVLPGIGEELVFRGVMQPQLERLTQNPWVSILLTALFFSAIHMQFEGFLPRFLLGMVLGWLYFATRNLWVPILAHLFNNGVQVLGVYLYKSGITSIDIEQDVDIPWFGAIISLAVTLAIGWLIVRITKHEQPVQSTGHTES
jgi:uncharacterized protein